MQHAPATRWGAVLAVFAGGLVAGSYIGKVPPALPDLRRELGLSLVQSGFIATTFNIVGGLAGMLAGVLCDRFGQKRLALTGLAIMTGGGLLVAAAHGYVWLLAARFCEGAGFILFTVTGAALMTAATGNPRDRAKALSLWSAYMPTGGSLALLLAPYALSAWGWRGLWSTLALAAALGFVLVARFAPAPAFGGNVRSLRLVLESLSQRGSLALALLFAFYVAQWSSVMIWLPTFLVDQRGLTDRAASALTALMVLANVPGNLAGGWLLAHGVRRGTLVVVACSLMAFCATGMFGDWLPDALRFALVLAFSACAGVIPASIFSGIAVHAKTPAHIGTTNGMMMQTSQAGQFFGPIVLAWLASRFGWGASLWAMLAFACGGAFCGLAVGAIEKRRAALD